MWTYALLQTDTAQNLGLGCDTCTLKVPMESSEENPLHSRYSSLDTRQDFKYICFQILDRTFGRFYLSHSSMSSMHRSGFPSACSAQLLVALQKVLRNAPQRKAQQSLGCKQGHPAGHARERQRHCPHLQKDNLNFTPAFGGQDYGER